MTYWALVRQRKKVMAAAKLPLKIRATDFQRPLSSVWAGERASNRPSRAAIAPPIIATINVRCSTIRLEPEMPVWKKERKMISTTGRRIMANNGRTRKRFSPSIVHFRQRGNPALDGGARTWPATAASVIEFYL